MNIVKSIQSDVVLVALYAIQQQNAGPWWAELGTGTVLVLLVLKMVLPYVAHGKKSSDNELSAGERTVDYWKLQLGTIVADSIADRVLPAIEEQTKVLRDMAREHTEQTALLKELVGAMRQGRAAGRGGI